MAVTQFEAAEVVSRANVNQRINQINAYFPVSIANGGTGATTAAQARQNLNVMGKPEHLYNNSSGSTGTITLNESCANIPYIEIYYKDNNDRFGSVGCYYPDGKKVALTIVTTTSNAGENNGTWLKTCDWTFSGTTVTPSIEEEGETALHTTGTLVSINDNQQIRICKIIAYKY